MKFSVITPALNCAQYIRRNIESVRRQAHAFGELEHWIIDGGSTDETIMLLKSEKDTRWRSEPDDGLADAVNKGIRLASGEWIIWLNADDELAPGALEDLNKAVNLWPDVSIFVGAEKIFSYDGTLECVAEAWNYNLSQLLGSRTAINQAATFVHRRVYERVGLLNTTFRYAMDYEWIVRAVHEFRCQPLNGVLAHYHRRRGSIMDAGIAGQHREFLRVRRMYGKSRWELSELKFRFYLASDWLRRIPVLRSMVRTLKRNFPTLFGIAR
jgi:glycosyltransferase involved in cell wall biosynthesis